MTFKTNIKGINFNQPKIRTQIIRLLNIASNKPGVAISAYCILSNHIHLVVQFDKVSDNRKLSIGTLFGDTIRMLVSQISKATNRFYRRKGKVFHDRYFMRVLKTGQEIINGFRYVLLNTVKHTHLPCHYQVRQDPRTSLFAYINGLVNFKLIRSTIFVLTRGERGYGTTDYIGIMENLVFN